MLCDFATMCPYQYSVVSSIYGVILINVLCRVGRNNISSEGEGRAAVDQIEAKVKHNRETFLSWRMRRPLYELHIQCVETLNRISAGTVEENCIISTVAASSGSSNSCKCRECYDVIFVGKVQSKVFANNDLIRYICSFL